MLGATHMESALVLHAVVDAWECWLGSWVASTQLAHVCAAGQPPEHPCCKKRLSYFAASSLFADELSPLIATVALAALAPLASAMVALPALKATIRSKQAEL